MTADENLARARHAYKVAITRKDAAAAKLKKAGLRALIEVEQQFGSQAEAAAVLHYSKPSLSKLRPSEGDASWSPRGLPFYKAVDNATETRHELVRLRAELDQAKRAVKEARDAVHDAQAAMDADVSDLGPASSTSTAAAVIIDDVLVSQEHRCVVLDVRVRNTGAVVANLTRVAVRILDRESYLVVYAPSADYDLLVDGDDGEIGVRHSLMPDEVDNFLVKLGFAEAEFGQVFTAELGVRYNGDQFAKHQPLVFDSCFD
jgi:hypothetical protein